MQSVSAEERIKRTNAIQEKLVGAALVPLEMVECAANLMQHCRRIAEIGNTNVLSDIATAAALTRAAAQGAASMVRINLRSMKNVEQVHQLEARLTSALEQVEAGGLQESARGGGRGGRAIKRVAR